MNSQLVRISSRLSILVSSGFGIAYGRALYMKSIGEDGTRWFHVNAAIQNKTADISGMRIAYKGKEEAFTEDQLVSKEPFSQFSAWFDQAAKVPGIEEPNAMALATASKDGKPSVRMVLLKGFGPEGFKFFTNYGSRKGKELEENPHASLMFYWEPLRRSIRIEGVVKKLSEKESTDYFKSRPLGSQIGAIVSPQSSPIANRNILLEKEKQLQKAAEKGALEKPKSWGGYILIPESIEFWQGQTNRIHDRIRFRRSQTKEDCDEKIVHIGTDGWVYERLAP